MNRKKKEDDLPGLYLRHTDLCACRISTSNISIHRVQGFRTVSFKDYMAMMLSFDIPSKYVLSFYFSDPYSYE